MADYIRQYLPQNAVESGSEKLKSETTHCTLSTKSSNTQERIVSLLPLPESLKNLGIVSHKEHHWATTVNYISDLYLSKADQISYVIGFSLSGQPIETSAIKYHGEYYATLLQKEEITPFRVAFELDAEALFEFHDRYSRPPVFIDYIDGLI